MASLDGDDFSPGTPLNQLEGLQKPQETRKPSGDLLSAAIGREDPYGPQASDVTMPTPQISQPYVQQPVTTDTQPSKKEPEKKTMDYIIDNKDSIMVAVIFLVLNSKIFKENLTKYVPSLFVESELTMSGLLFLATLAGVMFFLGKRFWR